MHFFSQILDFYIDHKQVLRERRQLVKQRRSSVHREESSKKRERADRFKKLFIGCVAVGFLAGSVGSGYSLYQSMNSQNRHHSTQLVNRNITQANNATSHFATTTGNTTKPSFTNKPPSFSDKSSVAPSTTASSSSTISDFSDTSSVATSTAASSPNTTFSFSETSSVDTNTTTIFTKKTP